MSRATKIVVVVVVLGLLAFAGWYFLVRDDAPSAVSLEDAVSEVDGSGDASASASGHSSDVGNPSSSFSLASLV